MKQLFVIFVALVALSTTGCSSNPISMADSFPSPSLPHVMKVSQAPVTDTVLLVSLEDGSVIKQIISVDADICFKQNSKSQTTCLVQGAPIYDAANRSICFSIIS
ncbi:MAG: hypothetical protein AAFN50_00950 [Pseudomonadota bacterium]